MFDSRNGDFHILHRNRPFFQGTQYTGTQFSLSELFAPVIGFDNPGIIEFGDLISGKAFSALNAFTPAPDLIPCISQPGIDDPGILR